MAAGAVKEDCNKADGDVKDFARYFMAVNLLMLATVSRMMYGTYERAPFLMNRYKAQWTRTSAHLSPIVLVRSCWR